MSQSDRNITPEELNQMHEKIGDLAKRALLEAAELRELEERLKAIADRSRNATDAKREE